MTNDNATTLAAVFGVAAMFLAWQLADTKSQPSTNLGGSNMDFDSTSKIVKYTRPNTAVQRVQSLDPHLVGVAQNYFGIDLQRLPQMSDAELAQYADRAEQMDGLMEALPILKKHFDKLIEGQTRYEQFLTDTQKAVTINAKAIDKNLLDIWLLSQGYQRHIKQMGQKAHNGIARLDAEHRSAVQLELLDFRSAMQLVQRKHQMKAEGIRGRLPAAIERERLATEEREASQRRRDLLTYGSRTNQNRGNDGFWSGVWDWFSGR